MSKPTLRRSCRHPWLTRALTLACGLLLGVVLAEILLRVLGVGVSVPWVFHPQRGIAYRPHAVFDHAGEGLSQLIRYNQDGFRDVDRAQAKPKGVYRIAVLGDSYVEAPQVALQDRFTEQLEAECNRRGLFAGQQVEVLNFGVSTYGTFQELKTLEQAVWQYQPDLVVLCFLTGNDLQNNGRELVSERKRPYLELRDGEYVEVPPETESRQADWMDRVTGWLPESRLRGLWRKVRYQQFMRNKRRVEGELMSIRAADRHEPVGFEAGLDAAVYASPKNLAWEHAWQITEELLRRVDRQCDEHGVEWLLVVLSNGIQVHPDRAMREQFRESIGHSTLFYPEERLQEAARRDAYPILCLAPPLLTVAERDQVLLHGFENMQPGFGHWNERGHRVAAEVVADHLQH